jgi:hypothetical protein
MVSFNNEPATQLVVVDNNGVPIINIGPGPDIVVTDPVTKQNLVIGIEPGTMRPAIIFHDGNLVETGFMVYDQPSNAVSFSGPGPFVLLNNLQIDLINSAVTKAVIFDDTTGFLFAGSPGVENTWINLAYLNAWTTRAGFFDLSYKIMPDGMVQLRGTCVPGGANTVAAQLPAAVRPAKNVSFPAAHDNVTAGQMARVTIDTSGNITPFGMAAAGTTFSFDQCKWPLV